MNAAAVAFKFRLYIVGGASNSLQAVANLEALCQERLADRHQIEVVDMLLQPKRALADGILLTPTLIRVFPKPICRIVGTLSDRLPVLQALGLPI